MYNANEKILVFLFGVSSVNLQTGNKILIMALRVPFVWKVIPS